MSDLTIKERILRAAFTAMSTDVPSDVPAPVRTRLDSPSAEQLPALTMYQGPEVVAPMREPDKDGTDVADPCVRRVLSIIAEAVVASEEDGADSLADPLTAHAIKSIIGAGTFGGLADRRAREIGTEPEYETSDLKYVRVTTEFQVEFTTLIDDPTKHDETE